MMIARRRSNILIFLVITVIPLFSHAIVFAQETPVISRPFALIIALAVLSLAPFILIMMTSFVKIAVVLSILRSALGTQQIPPTQVITGLAFILTIFIMTPVGLEIHREVKDIIKSPTNQIFSDTSFGLVAKAWTAGREPLREFLKKHAHQKERLLFYSLSKRMRKAEDRKMLTPKDFSVLIPAFVISELKEAFQIGFIIFVPFIVIDMVISNILLAMGMFMLSPTVISLPFKLLLFVLVDGWGLITKGLIIGYL
ncbi:MAG: type III secretion system export apparatus subunit SctR [bacterium]